ncbi:hypothetical protein FGU65_05975 [Methanoculleus sp. FWC-SCC1]|uniref:PGF-CTERM sorting domain-containing protein n=1 Tax=Methanoculleus frigidifontis TaxID=2584085 RepID=A0ABT8M946_9EURY|nr:hypothetical protein [Methanoculleus sp. FWC-SCC1]MDN7024439.1 hypothetical protein [Methanoculleus sp. FWC-SCC1]
MSGSRRAQKALLMALLVVGCVIAVPVSAQVDTPTATEIPFDETTPNETVTETPTETVTEIATETVTETPTETVTEIATETMTVTETVTESGAVVSGQEAENVTEVPVQVQPGETITVGSETQIYDLSGLRNATTDEPVTELRAYEDNNPETGTLVNTVSVGPIDTNVELSAADFGDTFGVYYPYDGQAVVDNSITVMEEEGGVAANETANVTETMTTETTATPAETETVTTEETPVETMTTEAMTPETTFTPMQETETPSPTPTTPLSFFSVLGALGILSLLIVVLRYRR